MKTRIAALLFASTGILTVMPPSCHPAASPDAGNEGGITPGGAVEAGGAITGGLCYLLEGVDSSGAVASVCAVIEEILAGVAYIAMLRKSPTDVPDAGTCQNIPQTSYCATAQERYKAVRYITTLRASRLLVDGGR
jgi:hypothetical protein